MPRRTIPQNQRRCLKFTGYIYVPTPVDMTNPKTVKYYMGHQGPGRIQLFDEHGNKIGTRMKAFKDIGEMMNIITGQLRKMWLKRF